MVKFFQTDLISLFNMKKIKMGTFDDYELFEGVYHCLGNTQLPCYTSASASIYVPWSATNAGAIISSIEVLSKYFAIYPLNGKTLKQSILLDVTFKANDLQALFYYEMHPPPQLRVIQNEVAKNNESLQCPPYVTNNLHLLNDKYGLNNIDYVCLKVLGCHHASYVNSEHVEGFGMTVGGFFFPSFKKHDESIKSDVHDRSMKKRLFESKLSSGDASGESSSESEEVVFVKEKSHRNEFASYFETDSCSSSNHEVFTLDDSSPSDELSVDSLRPVDQILIPEQEDGDVLVLRRISDEESTNFHRGSGR